ncbi:hypothetical protein CORC01_09072 [Colletotrichum orchidophilum]|uniref:Uncharacterized protein n=1 Tax=Colletotrichum orchidophilum TaxID=1209926 RepID=A0A1G4B2J3_9PEZI|nr:uncharacterized protein CORC01_09072 [Colletotrichum orchidophilum]OHE95640.1 hypothetical protein CORC01_09072 [Colletotrichum orchidophilum]
MRRFDTSLGNRLSLHAPPSSWCILPPTPPRPQYSPAQALPPPQSENPSGPTSVRRSQDTTGSSHKRHNPGPTPRSAFTKDERRGSESLLFARADGRKGGGDEARRLALQVSADGRQAGHQLSLQPCPQPQPFGLGFEEG